MSFESVDTKSKLLQTTRLVIIAVVVVGALYAATEPCLRAQSPNTWVWCPTIKSSTTL